MPTDITVVIPAFRHTRSMEQTLRSVLTQRDVTLEVLLMDGGPDGSVEQTVRNLHDPRVRHLRQAGPSCRSASELRNMAWPQAQGRLIHFLDAGDIVPDGHYVQVKAAFARQRSLGVVLGKIEGFGNPGEDVSRESRRLADGLAALAKHQGSKVSLASQLLFEPPSLIGGAGIIRKSCLVSAGGYNISLESMEDVDLYARVIRRFGAHFLDSVALRRRIERARLQATDTEQRQSSYRDIHQSFRQEHGLLDYCLLKLTARRASAKTRAEADSREPGRPVVAARA